VLAERALLAGLLADCRSPVAALARVQPDGRLHLAAEIMSEDGDETVSGEIMLDPARPGDAAALARELLSRASPALRALFGIAPHG
jgi:hydroxymethylbilane synthase